MPQSRLYELIARFDASERRRGGQFLELPEVNRREDVRLLYAHLVQSNRAFDSGDDVNIHTAIFPDQAYDAANFRLLKTYLLRTLERFLVFQESERSNDVYGPLLLRAYGRKKLHGHQEFELRKQQRQTERRPQTTAETLHADFLRMREATALQAREGRTRDLPMQETERALDRAYWAFKLRQACLSRSHEAVTKTNYQISLIEEILRESEHDLTPAILVYRACYLSLFHQPSDENFRRFREALRTHRHRFPVEEQRSLYLFALNYCIRQINRDRDAYLREAFELYRTGIETGTLLDKGRISRFTFNNVVGIALRLNELEWTDHFLHQYADTLDPAWRVRTLGLNAARLSYARHRYDDALVHLREVDQRDLITNMTAKILQLKIYTETEELELLDHHLRTMRRFIERNRRMAYHHTNWSNIVRFTQKVVEVNTFNARAVDALRREIEASDPLTERAWLLERLPD